MSAVRDAPRGLHWGIVQRQDSGFWYQLSRFESWYPSHFLIKAARNFLFAKLANRPRWPGESAASAVLSVLVALAAPPSQVCSQRSPHQFKRYRFPYAGRCQHIAFAGNEHGFECGVVFRKGKRLVCSHDDERRGVPVCVKRGGRYDRGA